MKRLKKNIRYTIINMIIKLVIRDQFYQSCKDFVFASEISLHIVGRVKHQKINF